MAAGRRGSRVDRADGRPRELDAALGVRVRRRRDVRTRARAGPRRGARAGLPEPVAVARPPRARHPRRVAASTAPAAPKPLAARHLLAAAAAPAARADRPPARRAAHRRALGEPRRRTSGSCSSRRSSASSLAIAISEGARRRRDARLLLIGLAFVVSAGFLGLHALATPGDRRRRARTRASCSRRRSASFSPGCLAAASAIEYRLETSLWIVRHGRAPARARARGDRRLGDRLARRAAAAQRAGQAVRRRRPARPRSPRPASSPTATRPSPTSAIYHRRRSGLAFAVAFAFALLAEALVVAVALAGDELAALVVGVARADGDRLPLDRRRGLARVERGALQRALPRRDAARPQGGDRPLRRPRRLHAVHRGARLGRRALDARRPTSAGSRR